jgi:hypothetical protein
MLIADLPGEIETVAKVATPAQRVSRMPSMFDSLGVQVP